VAVGVAASVGVVLLVFLRLKSNFDGRYLGLKILIMDVASEIHLRKKEEHSGSKFGSQVSRIIESIESP
jgi:hypothetical protein